MTERLRFGDMILANVDTYDTPRIGIFLVNANDGVTVDVADMAGIGMADLD